LPKPRDERWVTAAVASQALGISPATLRTWIKRSPTPPAWYRPGAVRGAGMGRPGALYDLPALRRHAAGRGPTGPKRRPARATAGPDPEPGPDPDDLEPSDPAPLDAPDPAPAPAPAPATPRRAPRALRSAEQIETALAAGQPITDDERQLLQDLHLARRTQTERGSAAKRQIEAGRASERLVDVEAVRDALEHGASRLRRALQRIEREFGEHAYRIACDGLDAALMEIDQRMPGKRRA